MWQAATHGSTYVRAYVRAYVRNLPERPPMYSIKLWPVASHFGGVAGSSGSIVRFRGVSLGAEAVSGTNAVADPDVEAATRTDLTFEGEAEAEAEAEARLARQRKSSKHF